MFFSSKEIREGGRQLLDKLQKYKPLIAAFNGKGKILETLKHFFSIIKVLRRLPHKAIQLA